MNDVLFQLASDLMAIGPVGSSHWTAVNPALAARLGLDDPSNGGVGLDHPPDPSLLTSRDGSYIAVDWTVREQDGTVYWVGKERQVSIVRELHHRLKNNLQFVISLLAFQTARSSDAKLQTQFATAESRVRAVARLHDSNYASVDFSEVEFGGYLRHLVRDLSAGEPASTVVNTADAALRISQAEPLALIAHELVRNALEHANASVVSVTLEYASDGKLCLTVKDDGEGLKDAPPGTGLELVNLMVAQIRGTLYVTDSNGTEITVIFELEEE